MQTQTKPTAEFDLLIVDNFLDPATCCDLIDEMRRSPAVPAPTYGKGETTVDERVRRVSRLSLPEKYVHELSTRLNAELPTLQEHFQIELGGIEEPQFLRYRVGDFFVAHQDGNTGLINLESDRTRRVSVTVFLNTQNVDEDGETYTGGSLVFSDWRTGARHEVGGQRGSLVAFRSETTHEVTPVTRGERFAIVSWYAAKLPK